MFAQDEPGETASKHTNVTFHEAKEGGTREAPPPVDPWPRSPSLYASGKLRVTAKELHVGFPVGGREGDECNG